MNIYLKAFVLIKCGEKYKYLNYIKPHINSVTDSHLVQIVASLKGTNK